MQGLATKDSLLNLISIKDVKNTKELSSKDLESKDEEFSGDFLSSLLVAIDETNEFLPDRLKISTKELSAQVLADIEKNSNLFANSGEENKLSIFESLSFMEVLGVLESLKIKNSEVNFSKLSNLSQHFLQNENNFNALKNAKNLDELLSIAKTLNLNVSSIKVDKILDLKNLFPNLNKANFFNSSLENSFKDLLNSKISNIVDKIEKKDKTKINDTKNLLSEALKLTKEKDENLNTKNLKNLDELSKPDTKKQDLQAYEIQNLSKESVELKQENIKKQILKNEVIQESKNEENNTSKQELKIEKNVLSLDKNLKDLENKEYGEKTSLKLENKEYEEKSSLKDVDLKNTNEKERLVLSEKEDKNSKNELESLKNLVQTKHLEDKEKPSNESNDDTQKKVELNIKIPQNKLDLNLGSNLNKDDNLQQENKQKDTNNIKESKTKEQNAETKTQTKDSSSELNSLVSSLSKVSLNELRTNLNIKETFSYFANDLKEQIQQFKAPLTRISISLNPSNLGEIEVTLIQRGSALHINFNSNPNTMAIFIQNQAEFKNSLVNMGFTGLEMNFSDQKQKEQKEQSSKNKNQYKISNDIKINEASSSLELILAKYF